MEASLHTFLIDLIVGHWWLIQAPAPLSSLRWNWKMQISNHLAAFPGSQPPPLGASQSPFIHITNDTLIILLGNSKGLSSSVSETGINHKITIIIIGWNEAWSQSVDIQAGIGLGACGSSHLTTLISYVKIIFWEWEWRGGFRGLREQEKMWNRHWRECESEWVRKM